MERNNKGMIVLVPLFPRVIEVSGCLMIVADGPASAAEVGGSMSPAFVFVCVKVWCAWLCGRTVVWLCGRVVVWWYGCMVVWLCGCVWLWCMVLYLVVWYCWWKCDVMMGWCCWCVGVLPCRCAVVQLCCRGVVMLCCGVGGVVKF